MVKSNKDEKEEFSPNVIRVLHIDDEEDFLFLTKEFVEKMSEGEIQVESLRNPMEVFERIKDNNIDIIVCDYLMEDLNGLDLLKQIKQREFQIPFIIFTGRGREEVVIDALNLGADYYIRKGLDAKSQYTELVHQIRTVLRHKKAEQALTESERTIRRERDLTQHYLNEANVMFVIVNENEIVELMNKEVTYILGYTEKDLIGKNWFTTAYSSEYVDELRFSFQQVIVGMQKPTPYFEIEMETKNGDKRIIAWRNTTIKDENDKVIKILGVGDDITQRKEIEAALQQSEEKYRKLVDTSPDSIILADLEEGNITLANQQAATMHGVENPEELIGSSLMEFIAPEDHERLMNIMKKQHFTSLEGTFEYTLLKKNGERFPAEIAPAVITDKANKPIALMAIGRDLTERKKAEEDLRESEKKYRGFVQNFDGIAFRGSIDFRPFFFHGAVEQITGYTEEDFVSGELTWDQLILPEDMKLLLAINEELENTPGFSNVMEYRILNKNGEIRWIRQHIQNIGSKEGEQFIVQGSLYDITERKLIEENLRESENKFKSLFDGIPDAVFVVDPETLSIIDCNKQAEMLLGLPKEKVITMKAIELHCEDKREFISKQFTRHSQGFEEIVESEVLASNNKRIPVSINANLITIKGKEYIQGIFRDITQRKEVEEKQKESEKLYKITFESTGTANFIAKSDKTINLVNSRFEELTSLKKTEIENKMKWSDFLTEEEVIRFEKLQELHFQDPTLAPDHFETSIILKDGTIINVYLTIKAIPESTDFIVTLIDISQIKLAEEQLKESEALYRTLFEATGTAKAIVRADSIVEKINDRLEEISGYSKEEVEGKRAWHSFVDESELERLLEYNKKRMIDPTSVPTSYETKLKDKKGNIVPSLVYVGVIPNTEKFVLSLTDISGTKEAENELLKSAELYKTIFEATGAANMIVGPNRIIKQVNSKLEEVSGYMRDDLIGRNWVEFAPESEMDNLLEFSRARKTDSSKIPAFYETKFVNRKGDVRNAIVNLTSIPLSEDYIVSLFDVTDMKLAEEELKKSEILYRNVFESTGMANVIYDLEASIILVNSRMEELSGYSREEIEGRKWTEFIPQPELNLMLEYNRKRMLQPESVPNQYETRFITKEGTTRNIIISVNPLPDSTNILASVVDISERKKIVDTLTRQKKELSDFVHLMGHDIRNCLSSIEGYSDLLLENEQEKELVLEKINNQTEYLRKLLNRSIELADAGQTIEKSEKVNLNKLVETIGAITIPQNIKLNHDPLVAVRADKEKLSQIFKNLFENAVLHGKPSQIYVTSKLLDKGIALRVENDGLQIEAKTVEEAFESTFTTKEKESIHGLTIVKKLVDAHGWKIRLADKQEKACFEILIPKEDVTEIF
ncbi:MAG: PAS domain S-box protein [Candidatus Heimdallarchaeota archaeon]|nr:PAS domain S-box protein [Candidatus Heimdallarchaeota archaeon]MCG3256027.1 PAS domain S-box protein [Candidatus Heimdallarchaeota archaeon]MCK4611097.1 PAS domain S-box protein [Candidatus Heimdallarchaeota archaeon]